MVIRVVVIRVVVIRVVVIRVVVIVGIEKWTEKAWILMKLTEPVKWIFHNDALVILLSLRCSRTDTFVMMLSYMPTKLGIARKLGKETAA